MKTIPLLFLLFVTPTVFSQIGGNSTGARSFGLAGNTTQLKDLWSIENNPAALSFIKVWQVGISYENYFSLKELSTRSILISSPIFDGAFGLSYKQFGYSAYNENKLGFTYGQLLGENFTMGIQLNYLNTRIEEGFGNRNTISGNIGLSTKLTNELSIAFTIINLNRAKLASYNDERYPTLLNIGISYEFSKKVLFLTEVSKDIDYKANLKTGIEYQIGELFSMRLGYATKPSMNSFGFGCMLENIQIDLASSFDHQLGLTTQVSLSYIPPIRER